MADCFRHCQYVKACFSRRKVPFVSPEFPELIDHRYFYHEYKSFKHGIGDYGSYTCGLVRNAVAAELLACNEDFADKDFLTSLPDFIDNPSVAGFMIEYAVLSSIRSNGLPIGPKIIGPMSVIIFEDDILQFRKDIIGKSVLYCPRKFNFKGIDGVIVQIEKKRPKGKKKRKLSMFPFQIILAPDSHSNSPGVFFNGYKKWTNDFDEFDVEPEFLWITPKWPELKEHDEHSKRKKPAYRERYIHLKDVSQDIWNRYQLALQSKAIPGDAGTEVKEDVEEHISTEE